MKTILLRVIAVFCLVLMPLGISAQTDDFAAKFKKLDPAEETRLRAILAEPIPSGALLATQRQRLFQKYEAASRLSDLAQQESVLREAVRIAPDLAEAFVDRY